MNPPLVIFGVLRRLNLGEQLVVALTLGLVVIYLFRGRKTGRRIVGAIGTVWLISIGVLAIGAMAILFGWVDPSPSTFVDDMVSAVSAAVDVAAGPLADRLGILVESGLG